MVAPLAAQDKPPAQPNSQSVGERAQEAELTVPDPPSEADLPDTERVIDEEEFAETVPELDPDDDPALDEPLESIEEFERRMSTGEAAPPRGSSEGAPLGQSELGDEDPVEAIGDAPIRDTALTEPLPPLESFELERVTFEEAEDEAERPVEIEYTIEIDGIENAQGATRVDLRDRFFELSALEQGDGDAANIAQLNARLSEDGELLGRLLAAEGWFGADVTTRLVPPIDDARQEPITATIDVVPGQRYSFSDIVVEAPAVEPSNLIVDALDLEPGEPIIARRVQAAEARISVELPQNGYPFVEVGQRDILLDRTTGEGTYTLPVDPGPRAVFNGIEVRGDLAFGADHVREIARFKPGELYDSRMVNDLREALVATGLFNTVAVSPERSGEETGSGAEYATIVVDQQAGPPRTIAGSAGFGTGRGFSLEGSWTHRNLFPPEGALSVRGLAGTQEQALGVTFRRSNAGRRDRSFEIGADALRSDFEAFEAFTGRIDALVRYASTPLWQKRITYAYGGQIFISDEQDFDIARNERVRRTFFVAGLKGEIGFDTTDSLLNPREGFRLTALVEPETSLEDGFEPYVRVQLDGSAYYPASDSFVIAGRVRLGSIQGIDRFELAPSRRFYAGGGGSVRGFGFQELGPRVLEPNPSFPEPGEIDPDTDPEDLPDPFITRPIGGRGLFEAAAEVRYRFGNFGVAAFVDAGQVYRDTLPQFDDIRFGVGIGGRYYTNFGPVRLDVAIPVDRRRGESAVAVYVSIGQAF